MPSLRYFKFCISKTPMRTWKTGAIASHINIWPEKKRDACGMQLAHRRSCGNRSGCWILSRSTVHPFKHMHEDRRWQQRMNPDRVTRWCSPAVWDPQWYSVFLESVKEPMKSNLGSNYCFQWKTFGRNQIRKDKKAYRLKAIFCQ